jgi:tetratricopeptide (TPR) repeat protein
MTAYGEPLWPEDTQLPDELAGRRPDVPARVSAEIDGVRRTMREGAREAGAEALRRLIAVTEPDETLRWVWAAAHQELADLVAQDQGRTDEVIARYRAALTFYSPQVCPVEHAKVQHNLGTVLLEQTTHDREDHLEQALDALTRAVAGRTGLGDGYGRGRSLNNLGNVYMSRIRGDKAANQAQAIAHYLAAIDEHPLDDHHDDFAMDHTNLALAYRARLAGDPVRNLDLAIASFTLALLVRRPHNAPARYRGLVNSLADTLLGRLEATPPECSSAVLTVFHPAVRELAEAPGAWRLPEILGAVADGQAPCPDLRWLPAPGLFDEYGYELAQSMALPDVVLGLLSSPQVSDDDRYRSQLLRGVLRRPDVLSPMLRADLLLHLAEALEDQPGRDRDLIEALTRAAELLPRPQAEDRWIRTQLALSGAFARTADGDRAEDLEHALHHCLAAASGRRESDPGTWAMCMQQLGRIYRDRIFGDPRDNAAKAIEALQAALTVWTRERHPVEWALTHNTMGTVYLEASFAGPVPKRLAVEAFENALTEITEAISPYQRAGIQNNLGNALLTGSQPEPAIAALSAALTARSRASAPKDWAETRHNLGKAYRERQVGVREDNLRRALEHYTAALDVHTLEDMPFDHRRSVGALGQTHADLGDWEAAHRAFDAARRAGEVLVGRVTTGAHGLDQVLTEGHEANELDAYALARSGRAGEAVEALEQGRAYGLAESFTILTADLARIADTDLRERYAAARDDLLAARRAVNEVPWRSLADPDPLLPEDPRTAAVPHAGAVYTATTRFNAVVDEIRATPQAPDFLDTDLRLADIPDGTVYLLATPWGGLALAVHTDESGKRASALPLPALDDAFVGKLARTRATDGSDSMLGGYLAAQEGTGLNWVFHEWPGSTLAERMRALCDHSDAAGADSTLAVALRAILTARGLSTVLDTPVEDLTRTAMNQAAAALNRDFLSAELDRCLPKLAAAALTPVAAWVRRLELGAVTLVPCGVLPAFPVASAPVEPVTAGATGGAGGGIGTGAAGGGPAGRTLADLVPITVAPSARTLIAADSPPAVRDGVFTLGDPRPTGQPLRWGEAEAKTVAALGGDRSRARVREAATREWFIASMRRGAVVSAACHGRFDGGDMLKSGLLLADGQRFTLADAFALTEDIAGLPLLVLSACQSAVVDMRGAPGEVRSLPTGMLQAGVRAVLAPLWSVDDQATYLLMTRFAQEYLPAMSTEHPGAALARAQAWIRDVTREELARWHPVVEGAETTEGAEVAEGFTVAAGSEDSDADRYSADEAQRFIAGLSAYHEGTEKPYAHPIHWAGFQVYGYGGAGAIPSER